MATFRDLSLNSGRLAIALRSDGRRRLVDAALVEGKRVALARVDRDIPGRRLRNVGRRGTRLGVGYDATGDSRGEVKFRPRGAWILIDAGAKRHVIGVGRRTASGRVTGTKRKRSNRDPNRYAAMRLPVARGRSGYRLGPITHHGFRGKGTLTRAMDEIEAALPAVVDAALADEVRRAL